MTLTASQQEFMDRAQEVESKEFNVDTNWSGRPVAGSKQWRETLKFRTKIQTLRALEKEGLLKIISYQRNVGATIEILNK